MYYVLKRKSINILGLSTYFTFLLHKTAILAVKFETFSHGFYAAAMEKARFYKRVCWKWSDLGRKYDIKRDMWNPWVFFSVKVVQGNLVKKVWFSLLLAKKIYES